MARKPTGKPNGRPPVIINKEKSCHISGCKKLETRCLDCGKLICDTFRTPDGMDQR